MAGRRTLHRDHRGQSLVEFALVFPVAILILVAIFDVGRAVFVYNSLTNAAREGARLAIVNQDKDLIVQRIQEQTFGAGLSNGADPNAVVSFRRGSPNADPLTNPACATLATGCVAVVTAQSQWSAITPIIGTLIGPITFTARSELPVEFVCPNASIPAYTTSSACPRQP